MNLECMELKGRHFAKLALSLLALTIMTLFIIAQSNAERLREISKDAESVHTESVATRTGRMAGNNKPGHSSPLDLL